MIEEAVYWPRRLLTNPPVRPQKKIKKNVRFQPQPRQQQQQQQHRNCALLFCLLRRHFNDCAPCWERRRRVTFWPSISVIIFFFWAFTDVIYTCGLGAERKQRRRFSGGTKVGPRHGHFALVFVFFSFLFYRGRYRVFFYLFFLL